ncbi:putative Beta-carotene ketolase [Actinacidiphila bryophytorum]|uniref:Beta-carotene ketolase n=1 Tax=Actinacidiphila bryophytorum TaxID=1436133 RepID=A0A9W4MKQ9_9ACTN|nr:putative Beta-carotene ketolase [Actinacidiphila bryophytorum]
MRLRGAGRVQAAVAEEGRVERRKRPVQQRRRLRRQAEREQAESLLGGQFRRVQPVQPGRPLLRARRRQLPLRLRRGPPEGALGAGRRMRPGEPGRGQRAHLRGSAARRAYRGLRRGHRVPRPVRDHRLECQTAPHRDRQRAVPRAVREPKRRQIVPLGGSVAPGVGGRPAAELRQVGGDPQQPPLRGPPAAPWPAAPQQPADQPQVGLDPVAYGRAAEPVVQLPKARHAGLQPVQHRPVHRVGVGAGLRRHLLAGTRTAVPGVLRPGRVPVGDGVEQRLLVGDRETPRVGRRVVEHAGKCRQAAFRRPGQPVGHAAVCGQPARPGAGVDIPRGDAERTGQRPLAVGLGDDTPVLPAPHLLPPGGHRHPERPRVLGYHPGDVLVAPAVSAPHVGQRMCRRGGVLACHVCAVHSPVPAAPPTPAPTSLRNRQFEYQSGSGPRSESRESAPPAFQTDATLRDYSKTTGPHLSPTAANRLAMRDHMT